MLRMLKLCNFGTLFLWIFVWQVLIVLQPSNGYKLDDRGPTTLLIKPYPYQLLADRDVDLLHGRSSSYTLPPLWQTPEKDKYQYATIDYGGPLLSSNRPKSGSDIWLTNEGGEAGGGGDGIGRGHEGYPMTSSEITMENLNDFDVNHMKNAIWLPAPPKYLNENANKEMILLQQPLVRHKYPLRRPLAETATNIRRYGKSVNVPSFMAQQRPDKKDTATSFLEELRKEDDDDDNSNNNNAGIEHTQDEEDSDGRGGDGDATAVNDAAAEVKDVDDTKITTNSNSNSNVAHTNNDDGTNYNEFVNTNPGKNSKTHAEKRKRAKSPPFRAKKKPKPLTSTPFLPAVSGGSMTNLGKFFRDLSKNVQFSEKYQWTSEEQKLLEGDPTFGNLHHHLSEPHLKTDQAGEWIKAIRFYRPSQKIRSLVAMNPHGQWAHGSQFLDPNYMWVGLGK